MRTPVRFVVFAGFAASLALATGLVEAGAPQGVSPGAADHIAVVEGRCPTFSWEATPGAARHQIVTYGLGDDADLSRLPWVDLERSTETLTVELPGGASSWTPAADQCLAPGARYVWFVRAVTDDDLPGEWSAPRFFSIAAVPSPEEAREAIRLLERYVAAGGDSDVLTGAISGETDRHRATAPGSVDWLPKSVTTAPAAVRGEHPGTSREAYGVLGTSASPDGAGLAAANSSGGADLVLDGSADHAPDARLSQSGVDVPSASDETFSFENSGAGSLDVHVAGSITGDELHVPYGLVVDDEGRWHGVGLYASKSQLYEREDSVDIPPGGIGGSPTAACDDANDLPLGGSCDTTTLNGDCYLKRSKESNWTSSISAAEWTCTYTNWSATNTYTAIARILCVSVPDP